MRILRGIRMMMVRLITRATCHCEVRATCFPEGEVPTILSLPFRVLRIFKSVSLNLKGIKGLTIEAHISIIKGVSGTIKPRS